MFNVILYGIFASLLCIAAGVIIYLAGEVKDRQGQINNLKLQLRLEENIHITSKTHSRSVIEELRGDLALERRQVQDLESAILLLHEHHQSTALEPTVDLVVSFKGYGPGPEDIPLFNA